MEKSRAQSLLVVCLVLGLLVGQSSASFDCYENCFVNCIKSFKPPAACTNICLKDCHITASSLDPQSFCKLGCAASLCTNVNTAKEEAKACVDSCSESYCAKN